MPTTKDRLEFTHAMARHTKATVRQCEALMRYAGTLQRLAEDDCNLDDGEAGLAKRTQKRDRMQRDVWRLCDAMREPKCPTCGVERDGEFIICHQRGCALVKKGIVLQPTPIFSNDPRGAVLKIRVPDGYTNDMGGEGICVPS